MGILSWTKYPNFSEKEFKCSATGECDMNPVLMDILQLIRNSLRQPMVITSGYRSIKHPREIVKEFPGEHTFGMAVDIACYGTRALDIIRLAQFYHIQRIGVNQKGDNQTRFVHLGIADRYKSEFPVSIWTY